VKPPLLGNINFYLSQTGKPIANMWQSSSDAEKSHMIDASDASNCDIAGASDADDNILQTSLETVV